MMGGIHLWYWGQSRVFRFRTRFSAIFLPSSYCTMEWDISMIQWEEGHLVKKRTQIRTVGMSGIKLCCHNLSYHDIPDLLLTLHLSCSKKVNRLIRYRC